MNERTLSRRRLRASAAVHLIDPALKDLDPKLTGAAQLQAAVEASVR